MRIQKKTSGFTLIELMMVIGIVSILAMIAASFYGDNVIAAKRSDGRRGLQDTATALEKCKSLYGRYDSPNCSIADGATVPSPEGLYDIDVDSNASTFTLTATPSAGSSQSADSDCTSMTLDNLGNRDGTGADASVCW